MLYFVSVFGIFSISLKSVQNIFVPIGNPALYYNTAELIATSGYRVETHFVPSSDGFILQLHRILPARRKLAPVVFFMHGMTLASDSWLMKGPEMDLAYILNDIGYDVWLGDSRGNYYSRNHKTLLPTDPSFWQYRYGWHFHQKTYWRPLYSTVGFSEAAFSFHEIGALDLPLTIDYILQTTKQEKLSFIGHSMGTTSFFILNSIRPEYNRKINVFIGFAPVAGMNAKLMVKEKRIVVNLAEKFLNNYKLRNETFEILPRVKWAPLLSNAFCRVGAATRDLCQDLLFFWAGYHSKGIPQKSLPMILSHAPAGLSIFVPLHYIQIIKSGRFQQFDYGSGENQRRYGMTQPPQYDLAKTTCPVSLHYSRGDFLANYTDVYSIINQLPNIVNLQELHQYNHIDFIWGRMAHVDIYPNVLKVLNKYSN